MKINLPKFNLPLRNIVTVSLGAIALSTFMSLAILSDADIKKYTPTQWALAITGSFSAGGWLILLLDRSWATELVLADIQEGIESLACEMEVLNRAIQMRELADLVEAQAIEAQAKITLLDKIRELKAESNPMEALEDAVEICLDADLWDDPARYKHRYQDTERFYDYERICPVNRDGRVEWEVYPDYDPPEDDESYVRQSPFVPFDCCFTCKYIGDSGDCAVVPLGCETGDPGELCREYQSAKPQDGPELIINLGESLRQARLEESILDQLTRIIAVFGQSTEGDDMSAMHQGSRYLFLQNDYEINVFRNNDAKLPDHIYRARSRSSHQHVWGVGNGYFFDRTTEEDRAYFTELAESIAQQGTGDAELEMNPAL